MNWNGKIAADSPTGRLIQLWTSWRFWSGLVLFVAPVVVALAMGYRDSTAIGFATGVLGYAVGADLIGSVSKSGGT